MATHPRKIVVLGGGGFFASHLLSVLKSRLSETEFVAVDQVQKLPAGRCHEGVNYHLGVDLADKETIVGYLRGASVVVNTVGCTSFSRHEVDRLFHLNAELAVVAADTCCRADVPWLVHISSVAALGYRQGLGDPIDEEFEFDWGVARRKRKYYMLSKHEGDFLLGAFSNSLALTLVHPAWMIGPGDLIYTPRLMQVMNRWFCVAPPGGINVADVRDVATGVGKLIEKGPVSGRFILGGENLTVKDMFRRVRKALDYKGPLVTIPRWTRRPFWHIASFCEAVSRHPISLTSDNVDSMYEWRYHSSARFQNAFGYQVRYSVEDSFQDYAQSL